jgi:hypothetical protein
MTGFRQKSVASDVSELLGWNRLSSQVIRMCAANDGERHRTNQQLASADVSDEFAAAEYDAARQQFCVNRFSEREAARQLAAICQLLLQVLARDFNVNMPGCIVIIPEKLGGMKVRICGHR